MNALSDITADYNNSVTSTAAAAADVDDVNTTLSYVYILLTTLTSILSIIGCTLLIVADAAFRDLRSSGRRLLTWLSIADCLTAIGNLLGVTWWYARPPYDEVVGYSAWCQLHSSLTVFSSISSFLWTVAVALNVYLCVGRNATTVANRLTLCYHAVCWTLPGIVALTALSLDVLGHDRNLHRPSWCWIDPNVELLSTLCWQYITGKAWEITCYFVIVGLYVPVKCKLQKQMQRWERESSGSGQKRQGLSDAVANANRKLILVPVVFIVLRMWGTLRFVINSHFVSDVDSNVMAWIVPLQGVGDTAQGFANCILFVFLVPSVRHRYQRALFSCCGRHMTRSRTNTNNEDAGTRRHHADSADCRAVISDIPLTDSPRTCSRL